MKARHMTCVGWLFCLLYGMGGYEGYYLVKYEVQNWKTTTLP